MEIKTLTQFKKVFKNTNWNNYRRMRDYDRYRKYEEIKKQLKMPSGEYEQTVLYLSEALNI